MRIMGVDLSVACTGLGLPGGRTVAVKPKSKGDQRLKEITDRIRLNAYGVDLVVIEGLGGRYLGEASRVIPMLHGAVRLKLMEDGIPYMLLSPSSLKKFATGSGTADKTAMALAALKRLGREYKTSDECDADWLRIAGRFAYGHCGLEPLENDRVLTMPQENLKALRWSISKKEPIVWPVVGGQEPWPDQAVRA
jgi:Holliday junction resolvasome RuvABC endonuclease subunit